MSVRTIALLCAVLVPGGCVRPQPTAQLAPMVGNSFRSVDDALDIAQKTLAAQGFSLERHDDRGVVVGYKGARVREVGAEIDCNMPPNTNPWVTLAVTVSASDRGGGSTVRVAGLTKLNIPAHAHPTVPGQGCASSGLAEGRVMSALGIPAGR